MQQMLAQAGEEAAGTGNVPLREHLTFEQG